MVEQVLLTTKEVASKLGVHINTVRSMVEDGRLKGIKTKGENGHWRFKSEDVEGLVNGGQYRTIETILKEVHYLLDDIPNALKNEGSKDSKAIWEFVNKYYGIRSVFGSYAVHADMETYRQIIDRKGFVWLGEGAENLMNVLNKNKNSQKHLNDKILSLETKFAFGVVKARSIFEEFSYSLVPLLVVKDSSDNIWIVDGTLQQFYPNMEKGLTVLPLEKAKELYMELTIYEKLEFATLYSDPYVSERFIQKAKLSEKEEC